MPDLIQAAAIADGDQLLLSAEVTIQAADADRPGPRRFEMLAYSGGLLHLPNFEHPVVVDLKGLSGAEKSRPILKDHNRGLLVGHTDKIVNDGKQLLASGIVSGSGAAAREVVDANDKGFPWQASIGARPLAKETVPPGRTVSVNGRLFEGPVIVATRARLGEISFVVLGADDNTSARIAATAAESDPMNFADWLKAKGFDVATISDAQKTYLEAQFTAEIKAAESAGAAVEASAGEDDEDPVKALRTRMSVERKRLAQIGAIEAQYSGRVAAPKLAEIMASATDNDWTSDKLELELIRAERPAARGGQGGNGAGGSGAKLDAQVIEAALSMSAGVSEANVAKSVPTADRERVMNLATGADMRGYSLHTAMDAVIHAAGMHYSGSRKSNGYIKTALQAEDAINASGFTTLSLSGVLSNVANKGLIAAYTAVETVWNQFCAVRSHSDFKVNTRYRLDSTGAFKKVGQDGELKNVGLSDASFTNQVATYGAIIALTRQMMINDDLGAFMEIPNFLGRLAALRIEEAVFVLLLSNPGSFFHANNANLKTGGGSALSISALTAAEQAFRDQVDSNGKPILVSPTKLLVGSALKVDADNIFAEKLLITGENATKPARNPHASKYPPITSPYINNTAITDQDGKAITGQSATKWWMFADPAVRAAIAVAFLNGQQTPTIESAQTDFNTLGMQWRGYHDFGVGMEDPKAAVQSNGA